MQLLEVKMSPCSMFLSLADVNLEDKSMNAHALFDKCENPEPDGRAYSS